MKNIEKKEELKVYSVPLYISNAIKSLNKLRDKEELLLNQINDYIRLTGFPKDIPFDLLKYIPDNDVIPGQIKADF